MVSGLSSVISSAFYAPSPSPSSTFCTWFHFGSSNFSNNKYSPPHPQEEEEEEECTCGTLIKPDSHFCSAIIAYLVASICLFHFHSILRGPCLPACFACISSTQESDRICLACCSKSPHPTFEAGTLSFRISFGPILLELICPSIDFIYSPASFFSSLHCVSAAE